MDLGDLIFFLIVIVIVASNFFKQIKKPPKKSPDQTQAAKKRGVKHVLEDILKDIQTQMEPGAETSSQRPGRGSLQWEDLILMEPENNVPPQSKQPPTESPPVRSKPVAGSIRQEAEFDELRGKGPESLEWDWDHGDAPKKQTRQVTQKPLMETPIEEPVLDFILPDGDLKNAIIWSEILSPPLGLRSS